MGIKAKSETKRMVPSQRSKLGKESTLNKMETFLEMYILRCTLKIREQ